jgi:polyhydroxyalkanoate synthesis regulator protein
MAMFERAMQMFSPFAATRATKSAEDDAKVNGAQDRTKPSEEISELKNEIEAMRRQLAELSQRK